jgi:hypothetical protein
MEARGSANAWRLERNKELLPVLAHFEDHLNPAVLLSMNTGLRRGELLKLRSRVNTQRVDRPVMFR